MENKQKMAQELEPDQLDKVSGGTEWVTVDLTEETQQKGYACPWCGQLFAARDRTFNTHLRKCPSAPPAPIIIG